MRDLKTPPWQAIWLTLAGWAAASIVDRVIIQALSHTTVGKAIFGLCAIRPDGTFPSFARLLGIWIVDLYMAIMLPIALIGGDGPGPDKIEDYFLSAVRRRDLHPPVAVAER